jgi:carbamoyl-phosphate synthase large subunit
VLTNTTEAEVKALRRSLDVRPVFKRIDTCAAEFASPTAYMYSTYTAPFAGKPADESQPSDARKVVILGGGPNRIGQGIEFDYCCCHACFALKDAGFETIMINCNPETVSTDYDTSDRLYFEPLTAEDVLEILDIERTRGELLGVIVQFGGQTPLKLARALEAADVPILGTSPEAIDLAEDRDRFKRLLDKLKLRQPKNGIAYSVEQSRLIAADLGLPFVVRPSYVLGGRAMAIVRDEQQFEEYLLGTLPSLIPSDVKARYPNDKTGQINTVLGQNPLLFDRYLSDAIEVDVDCLCDGKDVFIAGIMEHIEEAGIHSGDSACSLPPRSLSPETIAELERQTRALALAPRRGRPDERAIRHQGRHDLRAGGEPPRLAHGALRGQGHRRAHRQDRRPDHGGRGPGDLRPDQEGPAPYRRQGSRLPLRPLPGRGRAARARDALHGRGHRPRPGLRRRLRQEPARRGQPAAQDRNAVRVHPRLGQAPHPARRALLEQIGFQIVATAARSASRENGVKAARINKVLEAARTWSTPSRTATSSSSQHTEGAGALSDSRSLRRAALLHRCPITPLLQGAIAAAEASGLIERRSRVSPPNINTHTPSPFPSLPSSSTLIILFNNPISSLSSQNYLHHLPPSFLPPFFTPSPHSTVT